MLCFNPIYSKFYCLDECLKYKQFEFVVVKIIKVMKVIVGDCGGMVSWCLWWWQWQWGWQCWWWSGGNDDGSYNGGGSGMKVVAMAIVIVMVADGGGGGGNYMQW